MSFNYSNRFGGSPTYGDATAEVGNACVIPIGPDSYSLRRIIATYAIPGNVAGTVGPVDYVNSAFRSFTGRLIVLAGRIDEDTISSAPPNKALYLPLPNEVRRRVLFDVLIQGLNFFDPKIYDFNQSGIGPIINNTGELMNVILFASECFTNAGNRITNTVQMLHVNADKVASNTSSMEIAGGKLKTTN